MSNGKEPVIDPTKNVLQLVEAAIRRQDDLLAKDSKDIRETIRLRSEYDEKLRKAEAKRIDAIRAVDVGAVAAAAEVSATQATTLAGQVASSAEALRNQVAAAASAQTVALGAALDPIQKDIADLRRSQYEALGQKTQVVETRDIGGSRSIWIGLAVAIFFGLVSMLVGIGGLIVGLIR